MKTIKENYYQEILVLNYHKSIKKMKMRVMRVMKSLKVRKISSEVRKHSNNRRHKIYGNMILMLLVFNNGLMKLLQKKNNLIC